MARSAMKAQSLWQVSVSVAREAEDAAAGLLERLFGESASAYAPDQEDVSIVTVYSTAPPDQIRAKREALEAGLKHLTTCDLNLGPTRIVMRRVRRDDWATSWKKYFKTIELGGALLIRPSWSKREARPGQAVVTLDPGLSFGTGQHATTAFCLRQLVAARKPGQPQAFLDIGCGSGILAISAVKLGYDPVRAIDNDPLSVRVAKANARKNRVQERMTIRLEDLTKVPVQPKRAYDVVCANLVQDLLINELKRIVSRVLPGGVLVLSGLLEPQFAEVAAAYRRVGFKLQTARHQGEWKSGAFRAPEGRLKL